MGSRAAILAVFLLAILLGLVHQMIIAPQDTSALKPGVMVKFLVDKFDNTTTTTIDLVFVIKEIRQEGQNVIVSWEYENEEGEWYANLFEKPVVLVGEKWLILNNAFYTAASGYITKLRNKGYSIGMSVKVVFDLRMIFHYFLIYKGIPRYAKEYYFCARLIVDGREVNYLEVDAVYLSNGVLYSLRKMNITKLESLFINITEKWTLSDWNLPTFSAKSPVIDCATIIIIIILIAFDLKLIHSNYCKYLYESSS
mgnify:CR=1 FL=1